MKIIPTITQYVVISLCILFLSHNAHAKPNFIGEDFSGEYLCKGNNDVVGEYKVRFNLQFNATHSHDEVGVYDFVVQPDAQETYSGQAVAYSRRVAFTFKLPAVNNAPFSTGVGFFKKLDAKRWRFTNYYYEPNVNGGVSGFEYCKEVVKAAN